MNNSGIHNIDPHEHLRKIEAGNALADAAQERGDVLAERRYLEALNERLAATHTWPKNALQEFLNVPEAINN